MKRIGNERKEIRWRLTVENRGHNSEQKFKERTREESKKDAEIDDRETKRKKNV